VRPVHSHIWKQEQRATRQATKEAETRGEPIAVCQFNADLFTRPLARAQHLVAEHKTARIIIVSYPEG
jgi:hypothetical protein